MKTSSFTTRFVARRGALTALLSAGLSLGGCLSGGAIDDPALDSPESSAQAITGGTLVPTTSTFPTFTVSLGNCTGALVSHRHVVTAAHCLPRVTQTVSFYTGSALNGTTRVVVRVALPPGVAPQANDFTDVNGKFADVALLELDREVPTAYQPAQIPDVYPGNRHPGFMVGRGQHEGAPNPNSTLMYRASNTYSSNDYDGHLLVDSSDVNPGDSGGPFVTTGSDGRPVALGVLYGTVFEWAMRSKYTSLRYHAAWLREQMHAGYGMSYAAPSTGVTFAFAHDGTLTPRWSSQFSAWSDITAISQDEHAFYQSATGTFVVTRTDANGALTSAQSTNVGAFWTLMAPIDAAVTPGGTRTLFFYRSSDGSGRVVRYTPSTGAVTFGPTYPAYSFSTGWTHLARTENGALFFYNASTGVGFVGAWTGASFTGAPKYGFTAGWTHIVPAGGDRLFFYRAADGLAAVTRNTPSDAVTLRSWGSFSAAWTHVVGLAQGLLLFQNASGVTVTGRIVGETTPEFHQLRTATYAPASRIAGRL